MEFQAEIGMIRTDSYSRSSAREATMVEKQSKIFEELMTLQKKVFLICLGFSRNSADAQDLTQEVYLKAYKNIGSLKEAALSKLWLFRITRNTCLNFVKKHQLQKIFVLESGRNLTPPRTPESQMVYQEQLQTLKAAIRQLPKKQREIFILREYGGLSYQEIANTLKIKQGTVMSRLNRARKAIKDQMKGKTNDKEHQHKG